MSNTKNSTKPWHQALNTNLRSWIATGNTDNIASDLTEEIRDNNFKLDALIVIQDSNMGGRYYRYFWYKNGDRKRYCTVTSRWYLSCEEAVDKMHVGSIVTLCGVNDLVVHQGTGNDYVKLLLPVNHNE